MHLLDSETPAIKKYDELIARNVTIESDSFCARLRDYSFPIIELPSSTTTKAWKTSGLVILTEQLADSCSRRIVNVSVEPLPFPSIILTRTINPIKFYLNLTTKMYIDVGSRLRLTWGASIDPAISDVVRIMDTFTKPTLDPSPVYGFWDKGRIMFHGKYKVDLIGGGDIRLRVLGSLSPYRRKLGDLNLSSVNEGKNVSDGIEFVLARGARISFGNQEIANEFAVIEAGLLMASFILI